MARNNTPVDKNSREYLLRQVANGRYSLLLIVILTVVNLITRTRISCSPLPYRTIWYSWGWA